ncbi:serine acetyltransferase [Conexibacter sp. W3-3-2]|uniref:serine acetyltransferase n=1 Tax=Conexibacter sp. W3-3-2 TaxID=2675227 RepID=UPI0012B7B34A|nr:serine acetyltransferase [Conexibacter sp. W3-3-2]MTD43046.1 serine acetyltransferase [Conexibacter sp. W3-3-2]
MRTANTLRDRFEPTHSFVLGPVRLAAWLARRRVPLVPTLLQILTRVVFGADLPAGIRWPRQLVLLHNGLGMAIHADCRFEGPIVIAPAAMLGHRLVEPDGPPTFGPGVLVGNGAAVLGPVRVGRLCAIGAKALVIDDVPDFHIASGVPATVRPMRPDQVRSLAALMGLDAPDLPEDPDA